MKKNSFHELFEIMPRTKLLASEGLLDGEYPYYTASVEKKYINEANFTGPCLIIPAGGSAKIFFEKDKFSVSSDCIVVKAKDTNKTCVEYYFYYLLKNMEILNAGFQGVGIKHIRTDYLKKIVFPEITIVEQQEKAKILSVSIELEKILNAEEKLFENLQSSIYQSAIQGKVELVYFDEIAELIRGNSKKYEFIDEESGRALLNGTAIRNNKMIFSNLRYVTQDAFGITANKGDTVVVISGRTGGVAYISQEVPEMLLSQNLAKIDLKELDKIEMRFLAGALQSEFVQNQMNELAKSTTGTFLSIGRLKGIRIPVPTIVAQKRYLRLMEQIDLLWEQCQENKKQVEELKKAIFSKILDFPLSLLKINSSPDRSKRSISQLIKHNKDLKYHLTLEDYKKMKDQIFYLLKLKEELLQKFDIKEKEIVLRKKD